MSIFGDIMSAIFGKSAEASPQEASGGDTAEATAAPATEVDVEAILNGKKKIEYRSRKTNIREKVYLYASLKKPILEDLEDFGYTSEECPRGAIVGTVEIVDCTGVEGDYEIHLANPERLKAFLKPKSSMSHIMRG